MATSLDEQIAETMKFLGDVHMCGWGGCTNQFYGDDQPRGWATLTLSKPQSEREVVLCPKHGSELVGLLKAIGDGSAR